MGPSFTINRRRLRSALHRKPICLWRQHSRKGSQSNYGRLKQQQTSVLNPVLGKVLEMCLFCSNIVASLGRTLLVEALSETSKLDKPRGCFLRGENLWHWSQLEIRLNALRWSTIPLKTIHHHHHLCLLVVVHHRSRKHAVQKLLNFLCRILFGSPWSQSF